MKEKPIKQKQQDAQIYNIISTKVLSQVVFSCFFFDFNHFFWELNDE
jgi:hypothetical protein